MSQQLFAFRVAEPLPAPPADTAPSFGSYDPFTQTSTWEGGGPILAINCSKGWYGGVCCNAYGGYCENYPCVDNGIPYICDNE